MTYDNSPGSPDGPPKQSPANVLGKITGFAVATIGLVFVVVAMVWATAWMITNFPA